MRRLWSPCRRWPWSPKRHLCLTHYYAASLTNEAPICDHPRPGATKWLQGFVFYACEACGEIIEETDLRRVPRAIRMEIIR